MNEMIEAIENLVGEKIILFQDLVECLKEERKILVNSDINRLWKISDKKHEIASAVDEIRKKILALLDEASLPHQMKVPSFKLSMVIDLLPKDLNLNLKKRHVTLINIKNEVRSMARENRVYVEEQLAFLDDLVCMITDAAREQKGYNHKKSYQGREQANLLLHKEV